LTNFLIYLSTDTAGSFRKELVPVPDVKVPAKTRYPVPRPVGFPSQNIEKTFKKTLKMTILSSTSRNWCTDPIHVIHQSIRIKVS
jgi:hypothetical protein